MVVGGGATAADSKEDKTGHFLFVRESTVSAFFLLAAQKKNSDDTTRAFPPLTLNYE